MSNIEELQKLSTSEQMELFYKVIKPTAEKLIYYVEAKELAGYDDDLLALYFMLKMGGYTNE